MPTVNFPAKQILQGISAVLVLLTGVSCDDSPEADGSAAGHPPAILQCDPDNAGLKLPDGFCAAIVADSLGFIRHLAVSERGDIYVTLRNTRLNLGGILALRDTDNDGRMDQIEKINDIPGMGIQIHDGYLYFASDTDIYRYRLGKEQLVPDLPAQLLVRDLPKQTFHAGKPFVIDEARHLYVNIGSQSNACQEEERVAGSPGLDPCPELGRHAGIWRFSLDRLEQTQENDGYHYASGIRNTYALDWHPVFEKLYAVQHGRDQLYELWSNIYTEEQGARLPAEELLMISDSTDYGWPYCYFDPVLNKAILAPEYGGDGVKSGRCQKYPVPLIAFPAHYGPNDMLFYTASQFPVHYRNGAFIAFHGSYNRGPFEQVGYQVVFVPFAGGLPANQWEVFADGFAGEGEVHFPEDAEYRPTGLTIGADGSLYISDSVQGRIWRVIYQDREKGPGN